MFPISTANKSTDDMTKNKSPVKGFVVAFKVRTIWVSIITEGLAPFETPSKLS